MATVYIVKTNVVSATVRATHRIHRASIFFAAIFVVCSLTASNSTAKGSATSAATVGSASWYGEQHRGLLMANGKKFNPDRLTAASWFYPLGTRLRVTRISSSAKMPNAREVIVTVTDRGPAERLVQNGRIIDLSHAAFKQLERPGKGLVMVSIQPERY